MAVTGAVMLVTACIVITADDAVPGHRGRAAGGRHRDADPVRRRRRRTGQTDRVQPGAGGRADADHRRLVVLALPVALARASSCPPVALDRAITPFEKCLAVLVVITLSAYSYRFVEMPFRAGRPAHRLPRRRALVLYPASATPRGHHRGRRLVVDRLPGRRARRQPADHGRRRPDRRHLHDNTEALVRASVTAAKDKRAVPSNLTPDLLNLRDSIADVGDCDYEENVRTLCPHGDGDRTVVVIGDSHARAWIPAFRPDHRRRRLDGVLPREAAVHRRAHHRSPRSTPTSRSPTAPTSRSG